MRHLGAGGILGLTLILQHLQTTQNENFPELLIHWYDNALQS